jgi:hypothetical protein
MNHALLILAMLFHSIPLVLDGVELLLVHAFSLLLIVVVIVVAG